MFTKTRKTAEAVFSFGRVILRAMTKPRDINVGHTSTYNHEKERFRLRESVWRREEVSAGQTLGAPPLSREQAGPGGQWTVRWGCCVD